MIREVFVIITVFLCLYSNAQDVTNAYIKNIMFQWHDIDHNASHCGGDPGNESAEWKIRPYLDDDNFNNYADFHSSSDENSNSLYECDPYEKSDIDGVFNDYLINDIFYNEPNSNYTHIGAQYRIYFVAWESDGCGPTFEYNTGCTNSDDCPVGDDWSLFKDVSLEPGPGIYNGVWNEESLYFTRGSSNLLNRISIDYKFSISRFKGTFSTPFEFGTLDENGCFASKNHYFNTDDDNRSKTDDIWYTFTLSHKKSIRLDWTTNTFSSDPNVILIKSVFGINENLGGQTDQFKEYYNLDPGTYKIKIDLSDQAAHSTYKLVISTSTISSPTSVIHYWNGSKNDNWFEPCNWSTNHVPDKDNDVVISDVTITNLFLDPPRTLDLPRIYSIGNSVPDNAHGHSAGKAYCNSINIESGAKITIESNPLGTAEFRVNHP